MAKRSFKVSTWTPVAVADAANFTDNGHQSIQGTASTLTQVLEVYMGGQATSSAPSLMILGRDSTVGGTLTALGAGAVDGPLNAFTQALSSPVALFTASTTKPQRSTVYGLLNLSYNAFGGIVRWVAAPGEEIAMTGATASLGEISLSAYTGGTPGLTGSHIVYEPL